MQINLCTSALPLAQIPHPLLGERGGERLQEVGASALRSATEADTQRELHSFREINLPYQGDVAVPRLVEFPVHFEVGHQVLPAITEFDIADGPAREIRRATERHVDVFPSCLDELASTQSTQPRRVVPSRPLHVRSEQSVNTQFAAQLRIQDLQAHVHQQHRRVRVHDNFLDEAIAALAVGVREAVKQRVLLGTFDLMD